MEGLASKVGSRGTIVLPAKLRRRLGIEEGSFVVAEEREDGILIRPATVLPVEVYTFQRRAEFLLNNAVSSEDYRHARVEVKRMGLDPDNLAMQKRPTIKLDSPIHMLQSAIKGANGVVVGRVRNRLC